MDEYIIKQNWKVGESFGAVYTYNLFIAYMDEAKGIGGGILH